MVDINCRRREGYDYVSTATDPRYVALVPESATFARELGAKYRAQQRLKPYVSFEAVLPSYFDLMGVATRSGRVIDDTDREDTARTVVVNEAAARLLWPAEEAVGQEMSVAPGFPDTQVVQSR